MTKAYPIRLAACFTLACLLATSNSFAQQPSTVERASVGDAPDDPGPLAQGLSDHLDPAAIQTVMKKVGDWQIRVGESKFNSQWTFAALYDGLLAASATTGDPRYRDAVLKFAEKQHWKLVNDRFPHADDMALGQAYLDLYLSNPPASRKPERIANTKAVLDKLIARPDDPQKDLWWWCDALFMAPPVWSGLASVTHDAKYLNYMDHEWKITSSLLWDPHERLFFRDSGYFDKREKNGRKVFWSRGNGWVRGGLVRVLENLPTNDPARKFYLDKFQQMADSVAKIQSADGLWEGGVARCR